MKIFFKSNFKFFVILKKSHSKILFYHNQMSFCNEYKTFLRANNQFLKKKAKKFSFGQDVQFFKIYQSHYSRILYILPNTKKNC